MEFLIRFKQIHEDFRLAELHALAEVEQVDLKVLEYDSETPFCIVRLASEDEARRLIRRSILAQTIYEVWGSGSTYEEIHESVQANTASKWGDYAQKSFRFAFDCFQGTRSPSAQRDLINGFRYMDFLGPIKLKGAEVEFWLLEQWPTPSPQHKYTDPLKIWLGRAVAGSARDVVQTYDLKKRRYISTTSMDSELALVTANIAKAAPGKLYYDPFVGTGSFPVACAHFGAITWGSDIDIRSIRGKGKTNLFSNFKQYGLTQRFGDSFVADLTNTPLRNTRWLDGIICDPPYGVREGLKVLGSKDPNKGKVPVFRDGVPNHLVPGWVPPKKPYSFHAMLDDIVEFASQSLVADGRLSFWMPTTNDQTRDGVNVSPDDPPVEIHPPQHPRLALLSVCTQPFNNWSRKLITYRRLRDDEPDTRLDQAQYAALEGVSANELNPFRRRYFEGFR